MTDEILGFLALLACLVWSLLALLLMLKFRRNKAKNDWLDGDLHP